MQTVQEVLAQNQMSGYVGLQLPFVGCCVGCNATFIVHEKTRLTSAGGFMCDSCYNESPCNCDACRCGDGH